MLGRIGARFVSSTATGKITAAPFTIFQSTGMLMARPVPLQYSQLEDGETVVAKEGYISVTVIPRERPLADTDENTTLFNKDKKISVKLRSKQIGQIIAWKGYKSPFNVNGVYGSFGSGTGGSSGFGQVNMEFRPVQSSDEGGVVELTIVPKAGQDGSVVVTGSPVTIPISVGELKSFQILLESVIPQLYGWVGPVTAPRRSGTAGSCPQSAPKSPEDFFKQFSAAG